MTHEQLVAKCFLWHWNTHPNERRMLFGVNNNSIDAIEGNRNKAKGVVKGVYDFCYIGYKGQVTFLDAKIGRDKLSAEQLDFRKKVEMRGGLCVTFSSFEEFVEIIINLQNV